MTHQVEVLDASVSTSDPVDSKLVGIKGWLILPAIGLGLSPIIAIMGFFGAYLAFSDPNHTGYGANYLLLLLPQVGALLLYLYAAILFFKKKRNAPSVLIMLMLIGLGLSALTWAVLSQVEQFSSGNAEVMRTVERLTLQAISAAIWIPYFRMSKRVKATFVN